MGLLWIRDLFSGAPVVNRPTGDIYIYIHVHICIYIYIIVFEMRS